MLVRTLYRPGGSIENPTWNQVEAAIRDLDDPAAKVCLSAHPDGAMTISRLWNPDYFVIGPRGAYIQDPRSGRPTDRVELQVVLKAARRFLEYGELEPTLNWWNP